MTDLFKVSENVQRIAYDLSFLARAFATTGNMAMYDQLSSMSEALLKNVDSMRDISTKTCTDTMKQAEASSANMLRLALALSSDKKETP